MIGKIAAVLIVAVLTDVARARDAIPCAPLPQASCACNDRPPFVMFDGPAPSASDIPRLSAQLNRTVEAERLDAAQQLGRIEGNDVVMPLVGALRDSSCAVAAAAAWSLRSRTDQRAAEPLRYAMKHGGCLLRARAADVIETFGGPASVRAAVEALHDADSRVRAPAARALGAFGDRSAVPPLIAVMRDRDKHVRQGAAEALGRLHDARALPSLTAALRDENKEVRQAAADAIGRLGAS